MNIEHLIRNSYPALDAYSHADVARQHPNIDEGVVLTNQNLPVGIITSKDIVSKNYSLLMDFVTAKPVVAPAEKAFKVLEIMKNSGNRILMTKDKAGVTGTISQSDLLTHFHQQLEKQQQMLQAVAHDLRSPIASIRMLGQLLAENLKKPENIELIAVIDKACDQGERILMDILFSESLYAETLTLSEQDIDVLVADCTALHKGLLLQKQIQVKLNLEAAQTIALDESKFRRAINNLLQNGIKFSMPGSTIHVRTYVSGCSLFLEIEDHGIGVSADNLEKIFEKFTVAKRTGTNGEFTTGLGLYITRQIISLHQGTIKAYSDGKNGSTFSVTLPLNAGMA